MVCPAVQAARVFVWQGCALSVVYVRIGTIPEYLGKSHIAQLCHSEAGLEASRRQQAVNVCDVHDGRLQSRTLLHREPSPVPLGPARLLVERDHSLRDEAVVERFDVVVRVF